MKIEFTDTISSGLRKFADDLREEVLRPAAYSVAKVMYDELKIRAAKHVHTGTLLNSIYHYHDVKKSTKNKQVYAVGVNKKKAPHWHLIEFGTVHRQAYPYIRPTYDGKINAALEAGRQTLAEKLKEIT